MKKSLLFNIFISIIICLLFSLLISILNIPSIDSFGNRYGHLIAQTDSIKMFKLGFSTIQPTNSLTLLSRTNKSLNLDFTGDTLKCSGDLQPDSAATIFLRYVGERYSSRINSLKSQIAELQNKLNRKR